jgi:hypothetical protein
VLFEAAKQKKNFLKNGEAFPKKKLRNSVPRFENAKVFSSEVLKHVSWGQQRTRVIND